MNHQHLSCSRFAGSLPPSHQKQHIKCIIWLGTQQDGMSIECNLIFSAGELLKRRQPDPSALKAVRPDVALGRVFILAWAKN